MTENRGQNTEIGKICAVFKICHSLVRPICISHFIAHSDLFLLVNLDNIGLHMNYLTLKKKKTKLISHWKGEFLKSV